MVVVVDITDDMGIGMTGRIVDDEARRVQGFGPLEELDEPLAMLVVIDQISPPIFIDERPGDD